ncbi:MAG: MOSC domain-containing protein [Spongiibacteraceae bacterium]
MKINAINLATRQVMTNQGGTFETGIYKQPLGESVFVSSQGLEGDAIVDLAVHGGPDQAVYIYLQEDYDWWSEQLGKCLKPGTFGENVIIEGLADKNIVIGDILSINQLVLEITAPRVPCHKLASVMGSAIFVQQFIAANRPGFYGRVKQQGTISVGDEVTYTATVQECASIKDVFHVWHVKDKPLATLKKALGSPLAINYRRKIEAWYNQDLA